MLIFPSNKIYESPANRVFDKTLVSLRCVTSCKQVNIYARVNSIRTTRTGKTFLVVFHRDSLTSANLII